MKRHCLGSSLIELMVSLVLAAMILLAVAQLYVNLLKVIERQEYYSQRTEALLLIHTWLQHLLAKTGYLPLGSMLMGYPACNKQSQLLAYRIYHGITQLPEPMQKRVNRKSDTLLLRYYDGPSNLVTAIRQHKLIFTLPVKRNASCMLVSSQCYLILEASACQRIARLTFPATQLEVLTPPVYLGNLHEVWIYLSKAKQGKAKLYWRLDEGRPEELLNGLAQLQWSSCKNTGQTRALCLRLSFASGNRHPYQMGFKVGQYD